MDSAVPILLEPPLEAYGIEASHFSGCSSGSSSLNSTLSANEGRTADEDAMLEPCSYSERQQRCLHCERLSSECICLDSEDDDDNGDESAQNHPLTEWKSFPPPSSEAVIHPEVISGNQTPACFSRCPGKQEVEQHQRQQQEQCGAHQPLPSFEQLLASLGLAAGFVVYRSRHQ